MNRAILESLVSKLNWNMRAVTVCLSDCEEYEPTIELIDPKGRYVWVKSVEDAVDLILLTSLNDKEIPDDLVKAVFGESPKPKRVVYCWVGVKINGESIYEWATDARDIPVGAKTRPMEKLDSWDDLNSFQRSLVVSKFMKGQGL